ncbi:uncharacterized protein [Henckelia pumila]|uniref:uncharacterized protein n=1 Tax=Henckelia pumila TaxID=405737 RepID=UPI003C6E1F8B
MEGEKNTALFHNMSLLTGESSAPYEPKFDNIPVLVTEEDNCFLLAPFSEKEIHDCVLSIHPDSAAGPDGFSAGFYRNCWEIVKSYVIDAILPKIISPAQAGFATGRLIYDNILLAQEMVILHCVNNCWFSVMVNGSLSGFFQSRRGLRALHFSTGCSFRISHLAYADDLFIFANGSIPGIKILWNFLFHYEQCSGQLISNAKSVVLTASNCPPQKKGKYLEITGFGEGSLSIKYLGAPLFIGPKKSSYFSNIIVNVTKKLQGWDTQLLSFGSRLVLIKSVLCSMPIYLFQVMQPPGTILQRFEMLCAKFLWGSKEGNRKIHWVAWKNICLPVSEGGLGIRRLKDSLTAFSFKLWFRFRSVESLWSKFLVARYCKFYPSTVVQIKPNISPT